MPQMRQLQDGRAQLTFDEGEEGQRQIAYVRDALAHVQSEVMPDWTLDTLSESDRRAVIGALEVRTSGISKILDSISEAGFGAEPGGSAQHD